MAKLEQRPFEMLANMLAEILVKCDDSLMVHIDEVVTTVIKMCKEDNPRFDEDRFHAWIVKKFAETMISEIDVQQTEIAMAAEDYLKRIK